LFVAIILFFIFNITRIPQEDNALGYFRNFVKAIAKEVSMSKYGSNGQNFKESTNFVVCT
tara:strand:+ start:456 stop:635 length:180 start_codon:yes stop_codon:yes gene_type:complete